MGKFTELCDLLPADVNWGDHINPDIVEQIVLKARADATQLARAECAQVCEVMANNGHDGGWSIAAAIRAL